jgi:DNA helicase II / ATP-dependent DNA helicase PcrA
MPITKEFRRQYQKLNPRQREAVDAIDGPVMVIAGPGTGKTTILTLRIANILAKTDAEPRSILALTFTDKAAFNMRSRLADTIGQAAYGVRISTFHAFCNEIIAQSPDNFPHIMGGTPLADGEQLGIIEDLLRADDIDLLRPAGRPESYVRSIIGAIGDIKGKGFTPRQFSQSIQSADAEPKAIARMRELAHLYERYQKQLVEKNRYDYADMLVEVDRALEHDERLRMDLAEQYQWVLVDEHQDTNRLQNRIVQHIVEHDSAPNLFVVGDLEQAIYRFQGASPENFREFSKRYTSCCVIHLDTNYRSHQTILDAAHGISPGQGTLTTATNHPAMPIELYALSTPDAMEHAVAQLTAHAIAQGTPAGHIAVLYRKNKESDGLAAVFDNLNIPYAVQSDAEVLNNPEIVKLLAVIRAAHAIGTPAPLLEALHVDLLNVSPLDVVKVGQYARAEHLNPWDIVRSRRLLGRINAENADTLLAAYTTLRDAARIMRNTDATSALQAVVERIGWTAHATALPRGHEAIARLRALFGAVRAYTAGNKRAHLGDFLDALERMERHNADLAALAHPREDAVQLMTAHKAKGLEFDVVFIVNAVRGQWDDARKPPALPMPSQLRAADEDEDDVRRLFYVAATRARKRLCILWPQRTAEGKDLQPSRYVLAIPEPLRQACDTAPLERAYSAGSIPTVMSHQRTPALQQKEYIAQLLDEQPFSVTALNNFLQCPWKYYFVNLVRIPEAPTPKSEYGTAAHGALRTFFADITAEKRPTKTRLLATFITGLRRAPLPPATLKQLERKGREALSGWHDCWRSSWHPNVRTEESIDRVELVPGIVLTGKIDKVELLANGKVSVVDYKTKAPMSANEIRGMTRSATGNEYRQLLFYKILLDRWRVSTTGPRWRMESGQIDFLEPNASGKYKKESFAIETAMTKELEHTIIETVGHIKELSFWNERCGDRHCHYCRLRDCMK